MFKVKKDDFFTSMPLTKAETKEMKRG